MSIRLTLPLPPSLNTGKANPYAEHRAKRKYQREVWLAAVQQARPTQKPPTPVRVRATLYVHQFRDDDNASGGLKYLLDALRQKQTGSLRWREGIAERCGYFVDDNQEHLSLDTPEQVVDRKNMRCEVEITRREETR